MKENPVPKRLKEARLRAGLTQEALGIEAGIDEFTASARMNQYEKGKHLPTFELLVRCGQILNVPVEYFYASTDEMAKLLLFFHSLPSSERKQILEIIEQSTESS